MQTLTEKVLTLRPPGGIFDESSVRTLFPKLAVGARRALVHRAVKSGEVLRLRPGLFCLAPRYRSSHPHPFVIAGLLHSPSHISLESALSYHGLIPEAVHEISSVTAGRSRAFDTPMGRFTYLRVPTAAMRAGVQLLPIDPTGGAFVASPLRAIADLIYARKEVSWEKDGTSFLTQSMRIEPEDLQTLDLGGAAQIMSAIGNRRVGRYLAGLIKELS